MSQQQQTPSPARRKLSRRLLTAAMPQEQQMYGPSGGQLLAGVAFLIGVGLAAGVLLVKAWPLIGACVHWVVNLIW